MKIVIKAGTVEVNAKFRLKALANGLLHIANAIGAMAEKDGEWSFCIKPGDPICSNATYKLTMYMASKTDTEGAIPATGQKILVDGIDVTANITDFFDHKPAAVPTTPAPTGYTWVQALTLVNKKDKDVIVEVIAEPNNQNQTHIEFGDNPSVRLDEPNKWSACVRKKAVSEYDIIQLIGKINSNVSVPMQDVLVKFKDDPKEYSFLGNQGNLLPYDINLKIDQTATDAIFTLQHTRDEAMVTSIRIFPDNQDTFTGMKANAELNPTVSYDPIDKAWKSFIDPVKDTESNKWQYVHFATTGIEIGDINNLFEFKGNLVAYDDTIVITSPNGEDWSTRTTNLINAKSNAVSANEIVLIGGDDKPVLYTSTDPVMGGWGTVTIPESPGNTLFTDIVYNGRIFVAITQRYFYATNDTSIWNPQPLTDIDPTLVTTKLPVVKQLLTLDNGTLLVYIIPDTTGGDNTPVLYSSDDAVTWTKVTNFENVAYEPGFKLYTAGDVILLSHERMSNAWVSKDGGNTWTMTTSKQNTGNVKKFNVAGDDGFILLLNVGYPKSMLISTDALIWDTIVPELPIVNDVLATGTEAFTCMTTQTNGTPIAILRGLNAVFIKPKGGVPIENDSVYYKHLVKLGDKVVCVGNATQDRYNRVIVGKPY